jgi:hypothetical protein
MSMFTAVRLVGGGGSVFVGGGAGFVMVELMVMVSEGLSFSMALGGFESFLCMSMCSPGCYVTSGAWICPWGMAAEAFCSVCVGSF